MGLFLKAGDVPWSKPTNIQSHTGEDHKIDIALVYGEKSNLAIGRRAPGFHSTPHRHESEQLNYCAEGTVDLYIDDEVYTLEQGDFLRVPAWATHWAWNRSDADNVLIEVHTPTTKLDAHVPFAVGLFAEDEDVRRDEAKAIKYANNDLGAWLEQSLTTR